MNIAIIFSIIICVLFLIIRLLKYYKFLKTVYKLPISVFPPGIRDYLKLLRKPKLQYSIQFFQILNGVAALTRKEGICALFLSPMPYILLFSGKTLEPIMNSKIEIEKSSDYEHLKWVFGDGILISSGDKWKARRKMIMPLFQYQTMRNFVKSFDRHSKDLVTKLHEAKGNTIDIMFLSNRCALGNMIELTIGQKPSGKWMSEFITTTSKIVLTTTERMLKPWLYTDYISFLTQTRRTVTKGVNILLHEIIKVIGEKRENHRTENKETEIEGTKQLKRLSLIDILVEHQLTDKSLTDEDICGEINTISAAGTDTTSKAIGWTLYHLGRLPEIQRKVYEEQLSIFGDDKERAVTWNDLQNMNYLDHVIKESLRLSPPVPLILRKLTKDINIKGYTIPQGCTVLCLMYSLHRDPEVFPEPEVFDPDRFLPERCKERHPFAFIPFASGIRNCIGQKFAMLELKTVISNIVRNFLVHSLDDYDKILVVWNISLKPLGGLKLKFIKRSY